MRLQLAIVAGLSAFVSVAAAQSFGNGGGGVLNLYGLSDQGVTTFQNTAGRSVQSGTLGAGEAAILVAGQSHVANYNGTTPYTPAQAVHQLNPYDGVVYSFKDPVLGVDGTDGTYLGQLGDALIVAGKYTRVVWIACGIGGTRIGQWASPPTVGLTQWQSRLIACYARARGLGWTVTGIMWDQGTADNAAGTSQAAYQASFQNIYQALKAQGYAGKWLVAIHSMANNVTDATIQAAQQAVVNGVDVFQGADSDSLTGGTNLLADGSHFTNTGLTNNKNLWSPIIQSNF